jgi:hypothetical protein
MGTSLVLSFRVKPPPGIGAPAQGMGRKNTFYREIDEQSRYL